MKFFIKAFIIIFSFSALTGGYLLYCMNTASLLTTEELIQDLDFIYKTINQNHPGIYNKYDPQFKDNLEIFYNNAKQSLFKLSDTNQQKKTITNFAKNFDDSHLSIHWYEDQQKNSVSNKRQQKFQITSMHDQAIWLTLPTFHLNNEQSQEFNELLKILPELRNKQLLIFDLRGNQGGNSDYGSQIIDTLFGKEYAEQKRHEANKSIFVDWRASQDNLSYINSLFEHYQNSSLKDVAIWLKSITDGLRQSLINQDPYYREYFVIDNIANNHSIPPHPVAAKIIVVIDSSNVSAALDFIDELKMMKSEIMLIGQKTKADRLYMEVRTVGLPSNQGTFSFPIKIYRNRPRADNQPYLPDLEYETIDAEKLQKHILEMFYSCDH
jgi:hypothetical protein